MGILSIQSHVVYGYVGNKASVYPLQSMGFDVWPINTVQFSNHTGYGKYKGEIFPARHIKELVQGLDDIGVLKNCEAILSGYMGSNDICYEVKDIVEKIKKNNPNAIYLCDPVVGDKKIYVKQEVVDFFKNEMVADIITPNKFEAEILSGIKINSYDDLYKVAEIFHLKNIKIVIITGVEFSDKIENFLSIQGISFLQQATKYKFLQNISGTGDLFSALFLGQYLLNKDAVIALEKVLWFMEKVLKNSINNSELQVTSINYGSYEE